MTALRQPVLPANLPDSELSLRIAGGDVRAFEQFMRLNNRAAYRTARAILRDDAEAEEAVQDAYLIAYRSMTSFRGEAKLSTWLMRIVANEALARLRKRVRRATIVPIHGGTDVSEVSGDEQAEEPEQPQREVERHEIRRLLEAKIDELSDEYRTVFVLRGIEELSVEETAAALHIPQATVRSRYFRARSQLREALSREIDLAFDDAFAFAGDRCDRIVACVLAKLT